MTTAEIQPALKPWQWEARFLVVQAEFYGEDDMPSSGQAAAEIHAGPDYLYITEHQHPRFAVIDTPAQRHALAALCLHRQPFGFTPEDVEALRAADERIRAEWDHPNNPEPPTLRNLAAKIAALLPPTDQG